MEEVSAHCFRVDSVRRVGAGDFEGSDRDVANSVEIALTLYPTQ